MMPGGTYISDPKLYLKNEDNMKWVNSSIKYIKDKKFDAS